MEIKNTLQQLKAGRKAKRLRSLWPTIEEKLAEGVSHAAVLATLNEGGFDLTERTYKSYLYRFRKQRRANERQAAGARLTETTAPKAQELSQTEISPASTAISRRQRPATFDYDPRGISPELLK